MEHVDLIFTAILFVLLGFRMFAATIADDETKEIKHLCWAILYTVVLVGELVR